MIFTIKGEAEFTAKDEKSAFTKLGKYFLSLGSNKNDQEFEAIFDSGEIVISHESSETHLYKD